MATITRQPFAPLDDARLQTLTSLKNRQNGKKRGHARIRRRPPRILASLARPKS
jgi:hypothetical protein